MNPIFETVMLVIIAIIVLLVVVWVFGGFKSRKPEVQTELTTVPTETAKPVIHDYKVYKAPDLKNATSGPRACTYIKTGHFFKYDTPLPEGICCGSQRLPFPLAYPSNP